MSIDFNLSWEHQQIKKAMRACLEPFKDRREELTKMVVHDRIFPQEVWDAIAGTGLLGCMVPEEYGGNGLGLLGVAVGIEELAANGFGNALFVLTAMDMACIHRNGTEEMKQRYLPKMASGELKFGFAITEPDAGTNAFRMKTLATRDGDDYLITGQKVFITGADVADKLSLSLLKSQGKRASKPVLVVQGDGRFWLGIISPSMSRSRSRHHYAVAHLDRCFAMG